MEDKYIAYFKEWLYEITMNNFNDNEFVEHIEDIIERIDFGGLKNFIEYKENDDHTT